MLQALSSYLVSKRSEDVPRGSKNITLMQQPTTVINSVLHPFRPPSARFPFLRSTPSFSARLLFRALPPIAAASRTPRAPILRAPRTPRPILRIPRTLRSYHTALRARHVYPSASRSHRIHLPRTPRTLARTLHASHAAPALTLHAYTQKRRPA